MSPTFTSCFPSIQNKDEYFEKIAAEDHLVKRTICLYLMLCSFSFLYGLTMGSYHSAFQAVVSGVKVAALFSLALGICFPAFFVIQFVLGSKLKLLQMAVIVLSGFALLTAIMLSFAPIIVIFLLTGGNYYFLHLLHISIFIFAGLFGMKTIVDALRYLCEKKDIYPQTGVIVFRVWVVILGFVGIQLAWNLGPFIGVRGQPFQLFRKYEGNFYVAVVYSLGQLTGKPTTHTPAVDEAKRAEERAEMEKMGIKPMESR
jgi:hypothetical protein